MHSLGLRVLSKHASQTLTRQIASAIVGIVTTTVVARVLGPSDTGIFALMVLVSNSLATLTSLGIASSNVYFVGRREVSFSVALRTTVQIWFIVSLIGCLGAGLGIVFAHGFLFPDVPIAFLWISVITFPVLLLHALLSSLLQAKQAFSLYNSAVLIPMIGTMALTFLLLLGLDMGVLGAYLAATGGYALGAGYTWYACRRFRSEPMMSDAESSYWQPALHYGLRAHLSNILAFLNYRIDIFLINWLMGPAATGAYSIAVQFAERLWMLSSAVSTVLLPRLTELHEDEDTRKRLTPLVSRWVLMMTGFGALVIAVAIYPYVALFLGVQYAAVVPALWLLLPGVVMLGYSRVLATDIAARGRPGLNTLTSIVAVVSNVAANLVLIPLWGILGASVATSISYTLNAIAKAVLYSHLSGNPWLSTMLPDREDWKLAKIALLKVSKGLTKLGSQHV